MTWSRAAAIGDPPICLTVNSEGAAGVVEQVLFCLLESSDAFLPDILVSLSLYLLRPNRGVAVASRGGHGLERGGVDVDQMTSIK